METVDLKIKKDGKIELCKGEIAGTRPFYHTVLKGEKTEFKANEGYYHILILMCGEAVFENNGKNYTFSERTVFIPSPDESVSVSANTDTAILEIQWDIADGDTSLIKEYGTKFPIVQKYTESIQYVDPNKS